MHVHVEYGGAKAKFWMKPIRLASSYRMRAKQIRKARLIVEENADIIRERWDEYFSSTK